MVLAALVAAGKRVFIPWGEERFDFVIYDGASFLRVHVKTGCVKDGVVVFRTVSVDRGGGHRSYRGEVDLFAVHCLAFGTSYLLPAEGLPAGMASLRLTPPRSGQSCNIRWAPRLRAAGIRNGPGSRVARAPGRVAGGTDANVPP